MFYTESFRARLLLLSLFLTICLVLGATTSAFAVDYDIVYVRQPRYGDEVNTTWPEVWHPARLEPGADLVLLHPQGGQEVLIEGGLGAVTDPFVSFDGKWVYFSLFYDLSPERRRSNRNDLPYDGSDIYRIHVETREIEQLTFGEFTPNTGAGNWDESNPLDPPDEYNRLGYGILNLGPCPLPGGKIAFTSNRNAFEPPKGATAPTLQLFVMDENGENVTPIAPMTISSALHPTVLRDGRIMFSSHESQGIRDRRHWAVWYINPDGRQWGPVVSAFKKVSSFHFMTQLGSGDIVVTDYYNKNNNGFGALYRIPLNPPPGVPPFYSAFPQENPEIIASSGNDNFRMKFTPWGMYSITPFTHARDRAAPEGSSGRVGKFTHPSAAPNGDLLVVWTPGPASDKHRPTPVPRYDGGLYLLPGGEPAWNPEDLVLIRNQRQFNEAWPRAVVPYSSIHGVEKPEEIQWLPNDGTGHPELPTGTPYGLTGTSSLYKRESFPGEGEDEFDGLDPFYKLASSTNWNLQGAEAGKYTDNDIWAIRLLAMEPNTHRSFGPHKGRHFFNHASERLRILGEIPVRKYDANGEVVLDPEGNPDTSFLAKIPADTPFTFQTIDRRGLVLNMSQTWHQVRPGEMRADCGGCHAHSQIPLEFDQTAAASPDYEIVDLSKVTPLLTGDPQRLDVVQQGVVNVEFYRDIRPLLQRSCVPCHTRNDPDPPGALVLDDYAVSDGLPGDYKRLAADERADWGYPPVNDSDWRGHNASRYVRKFQSLRSLLTWKIFGQRLDGWSNNDHPTETVPGDPGTLPPGANPDMADLNFTGTIMPPPTSGVPPLTEEEKMTIARWIDLGAPINSGEETGDGDFGWFLDDLRPTLTVSSPRADRVTRDLSEIRVGMTDAYSGLDPASFSVQFDLSVAGRPPRAELSDLFVEESDGVWVLQLHEELPIFCKAHLLVEVADNQGNITRVDRFLQTPGCVFTDDFESGGVANWDGATP